MRDTIGELWIQTQIATTFRYDILYVFKVVTAKLQVVSRRSTYRMTALLSKMYILCVRAECEIRMVSYASKHALQSLSDKPYSVFRHKTQKLKVICGRSAYWTTAMLSETFFVWFRVAREIRLGNYSPRHASVVLWYSIVCVDFKPVYTSPFGMQLRLTTKLMHVPYDCILHTKWRLYCQSCIII